LLTMSRCNTDVIISLVMNPNGLASTTELPPRQASPGSLESLPTLRSVQSSNHATETALTQVDLDKLDHLRPPGLVFKGRLFYKPKLFKHKCICNSVSSTGRFVGWFGKKKFSIYQITGGVTLFCTGMLENRNIYRYGRTEKPDLKQFPGLAMAPNITCAALSDKYIAIGTDVALLIMSLQANPPGMLFCIAKHGDIENLAFSPSGDKLLVLLSTENRSHKAIIHSTSEFYRDLRLPNNAGPKSIDGAEVTEWKNLVGEILHTTFASNGNMAAVCTSHNETGHCRISLLKEYTRGWRIFGDYWIKVKQKKDAMRGMGNIAL
jgi:hypothetical protein